MSSPLEDQIIENRRLLQDPYAYLDGDGRYSAITAVTSDHGFHINIDEIRSPQTVGKRVSFESIEKVARSLHAAIWVNRKQLWKEAVSNDPVAILDPAVVFGAIGYSFEVSDSLGQIMTSHGMVDCAGFIDRPKVGISGQFPLPVRNFTAAHELGHAMLHDAAGMHRDRALDGGSVSVPRDRMEVEADKFATYFLMPEKVMRAEFEKRFLAEQFYISDDTAFALINDSQDALRHQCKDLRRLARKLADADHYIDKFFEPMSKRFRVSTEAMAIRLEELHLLQY